jgi:hypothetical protein
LQWIGFEDKEGYHNLSANTFSNKIYPQIWIKSETKVNKKRNWVIKRQNVAVINYNKINNSYTDIFNIIIKLYIKTKL